MTHGCGSVLDCTCPLALWIRRRQHSIQKECFEVKRQRTLRFAGTFNPEGIEASSPGFRGTSYPGAPCLRACLKTSSRRRQEAEHPAVRARNPPPHVGGYVIRPVIKQALSLPSRVRFHLVIVAGINPHWLGVAGAHKAAFPVELDRSAIGNQYVLMKALVFGHEQLH